MGDVLMRRYIESAAASAPSVSAPAHLAAVEVFDAFAAGHRPGLRRHFETAFELVAAPGQRLAPEGLHAGDVVIRRGEGFALAGVVAAPKRWSVSELRSAPLVRESDMPGEYVHVIEGGARPHSSSDGVARRLTDGEGFVPMGTLVLRPRLRAREAAAGEAVTDQAVGRVFGGGYALELDGVKVGWLSLAEGGEASGDVILEPSGLDRVVRKHLLGVRYNDITLGLGTEMSATVYKWIKAVLDRQLSRKSGAIIFADVQHRERERLGFTNALITEIRFPALDASSKEAGRIVLTLAPELTKRTPTPSHPIVTGLAAAKTQTKWLTANFRLHIDGLDASKVNRIEALIIKQKLAESAVGELRIVQKEVGTLEIPDLVVTLPEANAKTWVDWHEDFVVRGNSLADKEKNGTLEILGPNLKDVLFTLTFRHLGITRLTRPMPASGEGIARVKLEMYCEEMAFQPGTAPA